MNAPPTAGGDPASLFLRYYEEASQWTADQRSTATPVDLSFEDVARGCLSNDSGANAATQLAALVSGKACDNLAYRGRVLAAMQAIDDAFLVIHPRSVIAPATGVIPAWLRAMRLNRRSHGYYEKSATQYVIARGPLLRTPRDRHASSGDLLSDYFTALAVAPAVLEHDGRRIRVQVRVFDFDPFRGVPLGSAVGAETIGYLPLAGKRSDIVVTPHPRPGRSFAAYGPAPGFDAGAAALAGLRALGAADIAIMPELALGEAHVDALAAALATETAPVPRLIVAGSYSTTATNDEDRRWNECRVLNANGVELWRQRKLWQAGIGPATARNYGLPDYGPGSLIYENNASGEELVVADIDGMGRCVVLICQDCEAAILTPTLIMAYQPDWAFTPIFDCSIDPGRWLHARTFGLSQLSQTRWLAVTNMAFRSRGAKMGIAVGPKDVPGAHASEIPRGVKFVKKPGGRAPLAASLTWRDGIWDQTWMNARPAR